jgi:IS30 family transposase
MAADWGQAKIQILALKPEIEAALKAGKTVGAIYEDLRASHRISMSSVTFYRWCRRLSTTAKEHLAQGHVPQNRAKPALTNRQSPISNAPAPSISFPTSSDKPASRLVGQLAPEDENADDLM